MSNLLQSALLASVAVQTTFAGFDQIIEDVHNLLKNNATDRTIPKEAMGIIKEYGCWCYFENDHGQGKGKPVNKIDEQCKVLHDGYECAILDGLDEGNPCTPWEVPYNSATAYGLGFLSLGNIREECNRQNPVDSCQSRACMVEGWFAISMFEIFVSNYHIDETAVHSNGFDPIEECPIIKKGPSERECCGIYPIRFPYKTLNGDRDCCVERTYFTNLLSCCSDGKVRVTC